MTRRPLPLDDPALTRLDDPARRAMARHWQRRAWSEGQVADAFAALHAGLIEVGAAPVVRELIGRAAADEVRHSGVCTALAGAYRGAAVDPWRGPAVPLPEFKAEPRATAVTLQMVGMCCVGETLATVWLEASLAVARAPLARAAHREHLAEEVGHARAGWAHLAAPGTAGLAAVERWLPAFMRVGVSEWLAAGEELPALTGLADHGVLSLAEHRAAILRGCREVVLPGFAALGLDVAAAERWLPTA